MRRSSHTVGLIVTVLAILAFSAGVALPWTTDRATGARGQLAEEPAPIPSRPQETPTSGIPRPSRGVLAVGDDRMHEARACLEDRGITVHPRVVRDVDELQEVLTRAGQAYAGLVVHLEGDAQLVDGTIERALASMTSATRIVWSTIILEGLPWASFSYADRVNASVRNVIAPDPRGRVLDWQRAIDRHPQWHSYNGFSSDGCREYAKRAARLAGVVQRK